MNVACLHLKLLDRQQENDKLKKVVFLKYFNDYCRTFITSNALKASLD
jgi:hypothetical protein